MVYRISLDQPNDASAQGRQVLADADPQDSEVGTRAIGGEIQE
jgi:hypothetical protein